VIRYEFDIMFKNRVRASLKRAKAEGRDKADLNASPRERRLTLALMQKGQLHPADLEEMIGEVRAEVNIGL
jgi:hypothetical protein